MNLAKEKKEEIVTGFSKHAKDTGSCAVQIALLTEKINELTEHFKIFKKDYQSRRGLLRHVSQRRKLLNYLKKTKNEEYEELIKKLNIRK
ncbi:MAG: 30S ribosomal protein S15 [Candidatus Omnitrophica bacterium]|nr:30S ribosomal protein S15 [Candidatus Omnitrophota bacterium]